MIELQTRTKYGYDDLTRVTAANCGSAASQAFSYDPFGNLDKSGSPYSFLPSYSTSTNRMTTVGGFTVQYDSDGNVLNDNYHSYAWDADGHAISVDAGQSDAVSLTYDALGRMVEQTRGSSYTQIVYSPKGQKLALMSGSALQKALVPLGNRALAAYNSSGLLYYGHADYLGSIRLATTPSRTMYFDTAYAPFGEAYASAGTLDASYTGQTNDVASYRQDTAGGLYDFPLREYSSQGRWPNPDPLGRSATCPKDPQTQNRYAYVRNNPLSYTDPTGGMENPVDPSQGGGDPYCDPFSDPFCVLNGGPMIPLNQGPPGLLSTEERKFPWPSIPVGIFIPLQLTTDQGSNPNYRCNPKESPYCDPNVSDAASLCIHDECFFTWKWEAIGCAFTGSPWVVAACEALAAGQYYECFQNCKKKFPK